MRAGLNPRKEYTTLLIPPGCSFTGLFFFNFHGRGGDSPKSFLSCISSPQMLSEGWATVRAAHGVQRGTEFREPVFYFPSGLLSLVDLV